MTPAIGTKRSIIGRSLRAGAATAVILAVVACGSSNESSSSAAPSETAAADTSAAPATSGAAGGTVFTVPQQQGTAMPYVSTNSEGQLEGILPELSLAVGTAMGGTTNNVTTSFESALLGLSRNIYSWVPGADVTAERLEKFDFATTLQDSYSFVGPVGGVSIGDSMMDVCGHSVGVVSASSPVTVLQAQSKECESAGKEPIEVQTFADYATAGLAAKSHRVDVAVVSTSTAGYQIKTDPGVWETTGPKFNYVIIGDASPKGSGMAEKMADAINSLIADGTYAKILDKYGVADLAITESVVNPDPES